MNKSDFKWIADELAIAIVDTNNHAVSNCRGSYFMHFGKVLAYQQALISLGKVCIQIHTEEIKDSDHLDKIDSINFPLTKIEVYTDNQVKNWVNLRDEIYPALIKETI